MNPSPRLSWIACVLSASLASSLAACGGDDDSSCDPLAQSGCGEGLVCEEVRDGTPACFAPMIVRGRVFDLADDAAVAGARVVALDENGSPAGAVAISAADGSYELRVPTPRAADGSPEAADLTLRADAPTYQTFPSGIRQALPLDTGSPVLEDGKLIVESALTDLGLIALGAGAGTATIAGTVEAPPSGLGVLIVAETSSGAGGATGYTAVADRDGDFAIFNLPAGSYSVTAYVQGASYAPASVELAADADERVDLALDGRALGTVDGTVQIVNAPGGSLTTVLLVVESTFDETLARGFAPPGLRVPGAGLPADVSGEYQFTGVPAGRYVVLASFENDGLVRDPDTSIGGTSILHIDVVGGQATTVDGFKVTEALAIIGPGAEGPEAVTGAPMLRWQDDSSEDAYDIVCFDALGDIAWQTSIAGLSGEDPALPYGGPALQPGMYYQFRVTSMKDGTPISRSEDLRGVFYLP